jgi:hypothetical protein
MQLRLLFASVLVLLAGAACGTGETDPDTTNTTEPVSQGYCAPDVPDCEDTIVIDDGGSAAPSAGMLADGGLTVSEALATDATGVIAVRGFYFEDDSGRRMCELLAESLPPLCGGAELPLGESAQQFGGLRTTQGVTWSDRPVVILGEIVDGVLIPDDMSL